MHPLRARGCGTRRRSAASSGGRARQARQGPRAREGSVPHRFPARHPHIHRRDGNVSAARRIRGQMTATNTLHDDLSAAYGRHLENRRANRRKLRTAAIAGVAALVVTGAALGTATLLGWPAPEHVKKEIAAVDRGLPEDLRL